MGAVPTEKAGIGSAINDATRLFGEALGVAVIGSIAASLFDNRLTSRLPRALSPEARHAAKGSLGGALVTAQHLAHAGFANTARSLSDAAVGAFLHGFSGSLRVTGAIALIGAVIAALLLPSRPATTGETALVSDPGSGREELVA